MATMIDMIRVLEQNKSQTPAFPAAAFGPIRPLYSVEFKTLVNDPVNVPPALTRLISAIDKSAGPYDKSVDRTSRNDESMGAMRQIHSNKDPHWLPRLDRRPLGQTTSLGGRGGDSISSRMLAYDSYATKYKMQTNDNGGSNVSTGYIEFTASDPNVRPAMFSSEPERRARIVFDYVNGRVFLSPQHYHSWEIVGDSIELISGNDVSKFKAHHPNAFFWITEITTIY